jgi:hypothetical protein
VALAATRPDHAPDPGTDGQPISDSVNSRAATHWTRILYCDVFNAHTAVSTPDLSDLAHGGLQSTAPDLRTGPSRRKDSDIPVATKDSSCNAGSDSIGSPMQAAVILFAIIIAVCLAVANVLVSTDAVAVAPDRSLMPAMVVAAANPPVDAGKSPPVDSAGQVSERTEHSRDLQLECYDPFKLHVRLTCAPGTLQRKRQQPRMPTP